MKIKGRIIEVGSDGHHPVVTIHVPEIDDIRALGAKLYEHVEIVIPDATPPIVLCECGHTAAAHFTNEDTPIGCSYCGHNVCLAFRPVVG